MVDLEYRKGKIIKIDKMISGLVLQERQVVLSINISNKIYIKYKYILKNLYC